MEGQRTTVPHDESWKTTPTRHYPPAPDRTHRFAFQKCY